MKKWMIGSSLVLLSAGLVAGYFSYRSQQATDLSQRATRALAKEDFSAARVYSEKSLEIRPGDTKVLLVYAEAVFKDGNLDSEKRVQLALDALSRIPDDSDEGLRARMHEASIHFFDQLKPVKAERALRRALAISTDHTESLNSLMQIFCCTSRETLIEPLFESLVQNSQNRRQTREVLANWFLSQFSLGTYNSKTDPLLRVDGLYQVNIPLSQKRLLAFRDAEPGQQLPQVALAYWFYIRSDGKQAKLLLDELAPEQIDLSDPLYLITAVNTYFEVGEIELAATLHQYWKDETYFEYWRQKGVIEQDYENDPRQAVDSFQRALTIWPGPIDPSIYFRLETCLKTIGDQENASKYRKLGEEMRNTTSSERIRELQQILLEGELNQENCEKFVSFYETLGRQIEMQYWRSLPSLPE